ncbi:MAG: suppressor of fused domain protein [Lachnospiraceae bacterium]|nr:suppressor of fused domain protein [Lachnospiraceae bacterium]
MGFLDVFNKTKEPEIILESWSPVCDIQAFVEKSDTCYYLYLWGNQTSEQRFMKSCWICNRIKAPKTLDAKAMKNGQAPMMPEEFVAHDLKGMELEADKLEIVWFAEGDAASLLSDGQLICVIPGWADAENGFYGYSKYAKGMGNYAWELTNAESVLMKRTVDSKAIWAGLNGEYWPQVQAAHMEVLENFFGKHEKYFAIDGGKFPARALVTGTYNGVVYGITVGMSLIPMPRIEQYVMDSELTKLHRIELGFAATEQYRTLCELFYSTMSSLAAYPWQEITFFSHGHTVPFEAIDGFGAILFINPRLISALEQPEYKDYLADMSLLWLIPLTMQEYDYIMSEGSRALLEQAEDLENIHIFDGNPKFINE